MNRRKRGAAFRTKTVFGSLGTAAMAGAYLAQADSLPLWMRLTGGGVALLALGVSAWVGWPRLIKWATEDIHNDA